MEKLLISLIKYFRENRRIIEKAIEIDYKRWNRKIEFNKFLEIINKISYEYAENDMKSKDIKTYVVIFNGDPYVTFEMVIKLLLTNNNGIFMIRNYMFATNSILITIIQNIIKMLKIKLIIKLYNNVDLTNIISQEKDIDKIIYIGDKFTYEYIDQNSNLPVIYNGYGSAIVYVEEKEKFKDIIEKINILAEELNLEIKIYFNANIDIFIKDINSKNRNYSCTILSNDIKSIEKFKKLINSKNIYVNENPFRNLEFSFDMKLL